MIIARIFGGLGNQMFVYAAARRLAIKNGEKLVLDLRSGFPRDFYKRTPELHLFDIRCDEAGPLASLEFPGGRGVRAALKRTAAAIPGVSFFLENGEKRFLPELLAFEPSQLTFVEGYFQCERYFEDIAPILRDDFRMICDHDAKSVAVAEAIRAEVAPVAVHTRRLRNAPNVKQPKHVPGGTAAPLEYYVEAMKRVLDRQPRASFFCFSDYPEWFKENLRVDAKVTIVDVNQYGDPRAFEDFWLMRQCRHFITSNSTFAWWAAWLGEADDKIVIAPAASLWDNRDTIPDRWETIDAGSA